MSLGEAAGTAAALSLKENVTPRAVNVDELQRTLVKNGLNIGQGFRKLPALEALGNADYSDFNEKLINGNGRSYPIMKSPRLQESRGLFMIE